MSGAIGIDEMFKQLIENSKDAPDAKDIIRVCFDLARFLISKNASYGSSALTPLRVMSKADITEQIKVRMDDKLSRLVRGSAGGEDAMMDLVGYWVLLRVAERREEAAKMPPLKS